MNSMDLDPQDKGRDIKARMHGSINDYMIAPSGDGPLGPEWLNKPHRLIYDLCGTVQELEQQLASLTAQVETLTKERDRHQRGAEDYRQQLDEVKTVVGLMAGGVGLSVAQEVRARIEQAEVQVSTLTDQLNALQKKEK